MVVVVVVGVGVVVFFVVCSLFVFMNCYFGVFFFLRNKLINRKSVGMVIICDMWIGK